MKDAVHEITEFLKSTGHVMLEEPEAPRSVAVLPDQTAFVATLDFGAGRRRIVAKMIAPDASVGRPEALRAIHESIRSRDAVLGRNLPRFYEAVPNADWLLIEYLSGLPLDRVLGASLRSFKRPDDSCVAILERVAETQAALHRVRAEEVGLTTPCRLNSSYVAHFEAAWAECRIARLLPGGRADPRRLYDHLPDSFYDRVGDRVLAGDLQPKNVLVRGPEDVAFIDLDYIAGNPAIGLSQFLVGLDRLGLLHPWPSALGRIASWKRSYLAAYFRGRPGEVAEDLMFFYPWMLLQNLRIHTESRPWFGGYLRGCYGRRLREFLVGLDLRRRGQSPRCPVEFFTGACGEGRAAAISTSGPRRSRAPVAVPLDLDDAAPSRSSRPISTGVPFRMGVLQDLEGLTLNDPQGREVLTQVQPLARWPDGSVKWLLVESLLNSSSGGIGRWKLGPSAPRGPRPPSALLRVEDDRGGFRIENGPTTFHVGRDGQPLLRVLVEGRDVIDPKAVRVVLTDVAGREASPRIDTVVLESRGPVRATVRIEGRFKGRAGCRFAARFCFFAGTGLVRSRLTLHNADRARHPGGIWDLGDPGSVRFRDFSLEFSLAGEGRTRVSWSAEPGQEAQSMSGGDLEIYQDSSGGENWRSGNHVNREGRAPCSFRGYRMRAGERDGTGLRANPTVSVQGAGGRITAAVPEFWQQFPKALEVEGRTLRVRLFPGQFGEPFELQGGERKTHAVWLDFGAADGSPEGPLDWVHRPARLHAAPEWHADSGAIPYLIPAAPGGRLEAELAKAVEGPRSLAARREIIDEYGWRHFGEVYADHEAAYYKGRTPIVSHYNNQYDVVLGMILQYLRTGDRRWFELLDPLARHVVDIDVYHTDRDKSAYNGGLFWHTDHYRDAATCTHRAYSRTNRPPGGRGYGGGPCSEHNYTTGLLHYHYLTGDEAARDAVLSLADWVVNMDDGRLNVFGLLEAGPTGSASRTAEWGYHGPGRGSGNSINALLDGWLASGRRSYLDKAEDLIRRTIHPGDDVAARDLLNTEARWSYTVHLSNLARYLALKAEAGELDGMYAYARAGLLHYAGWMLEHEAPYFDRPEQLEFPTETWAAQEFRKANVLRLAAAHADEPLRSRLRGRGDALADRAWADLLRFESRDVARSLAILMREGTADAYFRARPVEPAPRHAGDHDFGAPQAFIAQKDRIRARLKTPGGIALSALRLAGSVLVRRPQ